MFWPPEKYSQATQQIYSNITKKIEGIDWLQPFDNYVWVKLARAMEQIAFGETW